MDQGSAGYLSPPASAPPLGTSRGAPGGPAAVQPGVPGPARRGPRRTAWLLRILLTLHGLSALAQPAVIGAYLQGSFDALGLHSGNSILLLMLALFATIGAVLFWIRGGRGWPALVLGALWLLEGFQIGMGYALVMVVHVPLGVLIVGAAVALMIWSWTPGARRARTGLL